MQVIILCGFITIFTLHINIDLSNKDTPAMRHVLLDCLPVSCAHLHPCFDSA